jgi:hypothetical protein
LRCFAKTYEWRKNVTRGRTFDTGESLRGQAGMGMIRKVIILFYFALLCFFATPLKADQLTVANFSTSSLKGWEHRILSGTTSYQLFHLNDKKILAAESQNSASGLLKKVHVDIKKYPYLNWSWRIESRLDIENEKIQSGDDYAARIYVIVDGGMLLWRTKAINYVWANSASKGEIWKNAFAGRHAMMIVLRSRQDKISTWYTEKRNVCEDFKRLFGTEFHFIDVIALMTDSDNIHGQASAYYGDIYFSER